MEESRWLQALRWYLLVSYDSVPEVAEEVMGIAQISKGSSLGCSVAQSRH